MMIPYVRIIIKMLEVFTLLVGSLQTNCYLVVDKKTEETLIIDPGDDADYIERIINDKKLKPVKIIATHGHFDHVMAVTELKLAYNIPFMIHKKDKFLLKQMAFSAKYFLNITTDPPPIADRYLKEKDKIRLGRNIFEIIETPGHTPGSICLYIEKDNLLFCGDLIFAGGGVGRTDFYYSNNEDFGQSIKKINKLPKKTKVYPGHGETFFLKEEKLFYQK